MSSKKHIIALSEAEREELEKVSGSHRHSMREKTRARILLLSDINCPRPLAEDNVVGSYSDPQIASRLSCTAWTVSQVRRRACERGVLEVVTHREQETRKARKLDGRGEAALVAVTCSAPPEGRTRWSLTLLRERLIEMEVVEDIGLETIRTTLKKIHSSHG